jgi:hypothetical protein
MDALFEKVDSLAKELPLLRILSNPKGLVKRLWST